jgi:hypothetical protein
MLVAEEPWTWDRNDMIGAMKHQVDERKTESHPGNTIADASRVEIIDG